MDGDRRRCSPVCGRSPRPTPAVAQRAPSAGHISASAGCPALGVSYRRPLVPGRSGGRWSRTQVVPFPARRRACWARGRGPQIGDRPLQERIEMQSFAALAEAVCRRCRGQRLAAVSMRSAPVTWSPSNPHTASLVGCSAGPNQYQQHRRGRAAAAISSVAAVQRRPAAMPGGGALATIPAASFVLDDQHQRMAVLSGMGRLCRASMLLRKYQRQPTRS